MYSLFDDFMTAPFGYTTPRDRVYVIPESEYAKPRHFDRVASKPAIAQPEHRGSKAFESSILRLRYEGCDTIAWTLGARCGR